MKVAIRVVLVDPVASSRDALIEVIDRMNGVWLAEVCVSTSVAARRIAELGPDLAIVVGGEDPSEAADLIQAIVRDNPNAAILSASQSQESTAIFPLVRAGAREFLPLPADGEELTKAFERLMGAADLALAESEQGAEPEVGDDPDPKGRVVAVTGAAGEAGCTSLAVNLATTLAKTSGLDVALVDFDLLFGSVDAQLNLFPEKTLEDVVKSLDRLDHTLLKRMFTRHPSGLYVLPRPYAIEDAARLDPETLRQALGLLKSAFPLIVLDTSKSIQASDFVAFESSDVILVVFQLDPICLRNTARLLQCFRQLEGLADRVQLVANRVGSYKNAISVGTAQELLQMPVYWKIPNATKIFHTARDRGVPLDAISTRGEAPRAIASIARSLAESPVPPQTRPSLGPLNSP